MARPVNTPTIARKPPKVRLPEGGGSLTTPSSTLPLKGSLGKLWAGPETGDPEPIMYLGGSGILEGTFLAHKDLLDIVRFRCFSYFQLGQARNSSDLREFETCATHGYTRAFLDSGAFSYQMFARRKDKPLDRKTATPIVDQYCDWVYQCPFNFDFIVTFDYDRSASETEWATKRIEARGLHPVPVFHLGSPMADLYRLIDQGYSFIGIGGMVGTPSSRLRPFLNQVFNITESAGVKCHGFGVGGNLIFAYPWKSVDSTTWLQDTRMGYIAKPSHDPRKLYSKVPASKKIATVLAAGVVDDHYIERAAINLRFWSTMLDRKRPPVRRGLF